MSNPATYDISTYEGDTFKITFRLVGDFTAKTPKFEVQASDGTYPIELTVGNGGIVMTYDAPTDKTSFDILITSTQTTNLNPSLLYAYDFQILDGVTLTTYIGGSFGISKEVSV